MLQQKKLEHWIRVEREMINVILKSIWHSQTCAQRTLDHWYRWAACWSPNDHYQNEAC